MSESQKVISISSISDLPEGYENISHIESHSLFTPKELRETLACLSVSDMDRGHTEFYIIVNIKSPDKMIYRDYISKVKDIPDCTYRVLRADGIDILKSLYASTLSESSDGNAFDSEVIDSVNDLIFEALMDNVSDIHIEVRKTLSKIRFRKHGSLFTFSQITKEKGSQMGIVIYQALSTESGVVFNPNVPQDAMVDQEFNGIRARLRIATAPASPDGFDMVIRLLKFGEKTTEYTLLSDLGYTSDQAKQIYAFSSDPIGLTIIAGTTGSGKSTTLKNLITKKIMDHKAALKVITVEDPPEYEIPNATQIPVIRDDKGSGEAGFSSAIRTAMRSDPDILMIGEVRDSQSASLLVSATQSGHQVLSTVHAPSAVGIIPRLESLGISRDVLSSSDFISGLIYQKLLPKICQVCAINYKRPDGTSNSAILEDSILLSLGFCSKSDIKKAKETYPNIRLIRALQDLEIISEKEASKAIKEHESKVESFQKSGFEARLIKTLKGSVHGVKFQGPGCSNCHNTGLIGRLVVAEILTPSKKLLTTIKGGNDLETLKVWRESRNGTTILTSAIKKISEGIVDPLHVEKEIGVLDAIF